MFESNRCRTLIVMACLAALSSHVGGAVISVPGDHPTIQDAIDAAVAGDVVEVAPGVYPECIDLGGLAITVRGTGGAAATTIDAAGFFVSAVLCTSGETSLTVIEGFTITGGSATLGGGIRCSSSSPAVTDCVISGNSAIFGGGVYSSSGTPTISGCTISGNSATTLGGGVYNSSSAPVLTDCVIDANDANSDAGGGMYNFSSTPTLTGCTFSGNSATYGGGLYNDDSDPPLVSCVFTGNIADQGAGLANDFGSEPTLVGCTFEDNLASIDGGAMFTSAGLPVVTDSFFCRNEPDHIQGAVTGSGFLAACAPATGGCCIEGTCVPLSDTDCAAVGGSFLGQGVDCAGATCAPACPADATGDDIVDVADLLDVLGAWGACP